MQPTTVVVKLTMSFVAGFEVGWLFLPMGASFLITGPGRVMIEGAVLVTEICPGKVPSVEIGTQCAFRMTTPGISSPAR